MVPSSSRVLEIRDEDGATICVEKGTTHQQNLADYFAAHGMRYRLLVIDSSKKVGEVFFAGRCGAYTSESSLPGSREPDKRKRFA